MFITIPCYPPTAQGEPNTTRTVPMTIAVGVIALMSAVDVPSAVEGLTKSATLIGLKLQGQQMISPWSVDEIKEEISQSSVASFHKFN